MGCYCSNDVQSSMFPDFKNVKYQNEVVSAIVKNNKAEISKYIPSKFDINFKMPLFNFRTALHIAAEHSDPSIVTYLIQLGADVNSLDQSRTPPIFLALYKGNLESVQVIFYSSSLVNINIKTNHDLHFHDFINKNKRIESIKLLSSFGYCHPGFIKKFIKINDKS